jgi:hypothetical protein
MGTPPPEPVLVANEFTLPKIFAAAATDAVVWRAWMRRQHMLDGASKMFEDQAVVERIRGATPAAAPPSNLPTRDEILRAIGAAAPE